MGITHFHRPKPAASCQSVSQSLTLKTEKSTAYAVRRELWCIISSSYSSGILNFTVCIYTYYMVYTHFLRTYTRCYLDTK